MCENNLFSEKDKKETVEVCKTILGKIKEISDNILRNIKPVDNRTVEELIDDDFIELDDRTQQQLEDDDYIELESHEESRDVDIDLTSAWDPKETTVADPRKPIIKLSTDYNKKVKVANKTKNKCKRKTIGQRNNKVSKNWLKTAGYLDSKDKKNYMYVPPKEIDANKISGEAAHFIRTEIDLTDFKKTNLVSKMRSDKKTQKNCT